VSADSFFTRLNPLIAGVLRSPLHWLLSPGLMLITVTGRRSGRRSTFPVGYQRDGDELTVMVSEARRKSWWRNFEEPAPIELRLRGRALRGRAEVVRPGSVAFERACARTLRRMPWLDRAFGIDYDRRRGLDEAQLEALGRQIAVVRIVLAA
jgi:hypothetical protein